MSKGLDFGGVHLTVQIQALGFLGKYDRDAEILCHDTGNAYAGGLDGQDFSDRGVGKSVFELFANLVDEWYIHLVVQEAVHLQYITRLYRAVF